jgi:hypothetical protein
MAKMRKSTKYPKVDTSLLLSLIALAGTLTLVALTASGVMRGPRGICPVCNVSESFSIAYNGGMTLSTSNVFVNVINWTATVDTLAFPDVPPAVLFTDLMSGTLDLATGTFTVGAPGVYAVEFNSYLNSAYIHVTVQGVGNALSYSQDNIIFGTLLKLQAGDVVRLTAVCDNAPLDLLRDTTTQESAELPTYALTWSMAKK